MKTARRIDRLLGELHPRAGAQEAEHGPMATFARGLAVGALVGAAIAGSTIWQRRRARANDDRTADGFADPRSVSEADTPPR